MTSQLPIDLIQTIQLTDLGVDVNNIGFKTVTLESEKFISLKAGEKLQVFNLELSAKVKSCVMSENVVFWHWVNNFDILIVSTTAVYLWSIEGISDPKRQFLLHDRLKGNQIIQVTCNKKMNWMLVVGITEKQGFVVGTTQLFNKDKGVSQIIEAHAANFFEFKLENAQNPTQALILASRDQNKAQLSIVEIDHAEGNPVLEKRKVDIPFPPEAVKDFPVAVQTSEKYGLAYVVTKYGFFHIYSVETGASIFSTRISGETVFLTTPSNNGIMCINRKGSVLIAKPNEATIVGYIMANSRDVETALKLASRGGLPGAEDLYVQKFQQMLANGNYMEAAVTAARSPGGILRTTDTISRLKNLPSTAGQLSPILNYFATILETGELNRYEAIELTRPVLAMNRKQLLENWLKENKLECSEELGDIVYEHDVTLALSIYLRAAAHGKAVNCFAQLGQFDKISLYSQKTGFVPNWSDLLNQASKLDGDKACTLATMLVKAQPPLMSADAAASILMGHNLIPQTTSFLLDALRDNNESDGPLQTKLLEINLMHAPQVADAILGNRVFTHFDKNRIAQLCERAGLNQRALELYSNIDDIRRVAASAGGISPEWIVEYLGNIPPNNAVLVLRDMLLKDMQQNMQAVVQASTKYSESIGSQSLITMFEETRCFDGLYYYLGSVVNTTTDPAVVFKYIQIACQVGQFKEVERVIRDNNNYDAEKVKNFLTEAQLPDQLPLIIVCDKNGFVRDLILHLYKYNHNKFIEVYVQQVNSSRLPDVVGALLDVDCDENVIKNLISTVNVGGYSALDLINEVESRGRLKLLHKWLEARASEGSNEQAVYNGLAKLYIETNIEPEHFLRTNTMYDGLLVGSYCEKRDPNLAFVAYSSAQSVGKTDKEIVRLAISSSMFRQLAKYIIARKDISLWERILTDPEVDSSSRKMFVDQVIGHGISETSNAEEISVTVKAFMTFDLPNELIFILEKLLLNSTEFSGNSNLHNLLLLTAIKVGSDKLGVYINKLDNYNSEDIAAICINNGLFEEALTIYKKVSMHEKAIGVLIDHIKSIDRAYEFAEQTDLPEVWSKLGKAQLDDLRVPEAITSYIKANDPSNYQQIIQIASKALKYNELIRFLSMARLKIREPIVESELLFAYAYTNRLNDMEELVKGPNIAQIHSVGERCYQNKLYSAAKILFSSISSWGQLASTLVMLEDYRAAVDCCRKANSTVVWRQVNMACIAKEEFRLAQICGLYLIVNPEELDPLVQTYESNGYIDELCSLLENGLGLEKAHMGMFTALAVLYIRYKPEQTMEFLKLYWSRINIPKVIKACEEVHLWSELVFLYTHYEDFDNACMAMIDHASDSFEHMNFKELISKVSNSELIYKSIRFYLSEHPLLVNELLISLMTKLDLSRVVGIFVKSDNVPLIRPFLEQASQLGDRVNSAVIEALHDLYIESFDYTLLRRSISVHKDFDQKKLALNLKDHKLLEFRRIATFLFNRLSMFNESIELSKKDKLYSDAIATAKLGNSQKIVHELLQYFLSPLLAEISDEGSSVGDCCFLACLTINNHLINPSFVMELAYKYNKSNIAMPFFINYTHNMYNQLNHLTAEVESIKLALSGNNGNSGVGGSGQTNVGLGGRLMIAPASTPSFPQNSNVYGVTPVGSNPGGVPFGGSGSLPQYNYSGNHNF
ncbi:hypothetical protein BB559_000117 [Furculomyces boomerangus]|uniref:Clathrin heavy chain n=2 Tax=Harpellales TaxID=61421 RepID=A0A2T9Z6D6_9FUNG|nr:hypothetical protein BB559_000117 [Furculomyces boomerangus]PWA00564.1 hypothetical protein BB558_003363 [Smittium angustum]